MNLILLHPADFVADDRVRLAGRRLDHVHDIHRAGVGDSLCVGLLDGPVGRGTVLSLSREALEMEVELTGSPPPALQVALVLALPRPPVLRRVLIAAASMGVKRIFLIGARGVEKSYWQSHAARPEAIGEQLHLGLEQGRDTAMPEVLLRQRFRPFAEDELPALAEGRDSFFAHPGPVASGPSPPGPALLAIGPESGWTDHERLLLASAGLQALSLGERPLRVETAVAALLARWL